MDTLFLALRVVLSLAAVLALLWLLQRRLSKRPRKRANANSVTVVARQSLSRRASVVMVDVDGTRLLLGVTEQSVNVLHSGEAPEAVSHAAEFAHSLTRASSRIAPEPPSAHPAAVHSAAVHRAAVNEGESSPVAMLRPRRDRSVTGRLGGSILSPATWKQTGAVLRQGR